MLSQKALLANLVVSQWTGRKFDKTATGTVEVAHATEKQVGNYSKKLLPGAEELAEIQRLTGAMRVFFHHNTVQWQSDGTRMVKSDIFMEFMDAFRVRKVEFEQAVATFIAAYPELRERARVKLGNLFRESEYPSVAKLKNAFSCELSFAPVPDIGDFRMELPESEKEAFRSRMRETEELAVRDCYNRLSEVVQKAVDRLNAPGAVFKDTLIENINDMCAMLPKLNVTDDPALEAMRVQVAQITAGISPDACRAKDGVARAEAARKLAEVTNKMSVFMGVT